MLWLHIGMPKTGTTALQNYLYKHPDLLTRHGVHYMVTGRDRGTGEAKLICHNSMAVDMNSNWKTAPKNQSTAFRDEYKAHADKHCVVSSEMFFGRDLAALNAHLFEGLDTPVRIFVYLRRFDDFIEADYKQRAKRNRDVGGGVHAYVAGRIKAIDEDPDFLNFESLFDQIKIAMPNAEIVPRLYVREELVGQNVIPDFLSLFDVPPEDVPLPRAESNRTLSRLTAEALGLFNPKLGFDIRAIRRLDRAVQRLNDPRLFRKGDVLTLSESREINERLEERNANLRKTYFPDRERLFAETKPKHDGPERGHPDELLEFREIMAIILQLMADGHWPTPEP